MTLKKFFKILENYFEEQGEKLSRRDRIKNRSFAVRKRDGWKMFRGTNLNLFTHRNYVVTNVWPTYSNGMIYFYFRAEKKKRLQQEAA